MSEITILRTERPVGYLERDLEPYTRLALIPNLSLPPIITALNNRIDLNHYESKEDAGFVYYSHKEKSGPLHDFYVLPNGIFIENDDKTSAELCEAIARELIPSVDLIPISQWKPSTVEDLRYFSRLHPKIGNKKEIIRFIKETNPDKILIPLPESDEVLQFCLEKAGLKTLEGKIHYRLLRDTTGYAVLQPKAPVSLCVFPPNFTVYEERFCIGNSLGYLTFGGRTGFDPEKHLQERRLQDYVLACYLRNYSEDFNPRDQRVFNDSPPRLIPALTVLSRIWDKYKKRDERDEAVRNVWKNRFDHMFTRKEFGESDELTDWMDRNL